jgi:hypothetical protein
MKTRLSLGFLIVAAGVVLYLALVPRSAEHDAVPEVPAPAPAPADGAADAPAGPDARFNALRAAYAELENDRRDLSRQIGSLQVRLWGRELPAEKAHEIQQDMMTAQHLVKDPPMLGAFRDVAGIERERQRVRASITRLREIEEQLPPDPFSEPAFPQEDR